MMAKAPKEISLGQYYSSQINKYNKLGYSNDFIEEQIIMDLRFGEVQAFGKKLIYNDSDSLEARRFIASTSDLMQDFFPNKNFYGTTLSRKTNIPIDFWKDYIFFSGCGIVDISFPECSCGIRHEHENGLELWEQITIIEHKDNNNYGRPPTYKQENKDKLIKYALDKLEYEAGYRPPDFKQSDLINDLAFEAEKYFGTNPDVIPSTSTLKRWVKEVENLYLKTKD